MCAGDLSLEHSVVPDEFGFNGWGTAHACADWGAMWELAVEHRYEQQQQQQKKTAGRRGQPPVVDKQQTGGK
ncbi:hypothetical protein ACJBU6_05189 [Exserohilum turcicum]